MKLSIRNLLYEISGKGSSKKIIFITTNCENAQRDSRKSAITAPILNEIFQKELVNKSFEQYFTKDFELEDNFIYIDIFSNLKVKKLLKKNKNINFPN